MKRTLNEKTQEELHLYELKDLKQTNSLRSAYGDDIILYDDNDQSVVYKLLAEFQLGDRAYAVVQQENEDEPEIYRVIAGTDSEPELETIEDDDEWENVSELYDEMTFPENNA
jgi:uncharacterized protein YrzB (UPF0473 family)